MTTTSGSRPSPPLLLHTHSTRFGSGADGFEKSRAGTRRTGVRIIITVAFAAAAVTHGTASITITITIITTSVGAGYIAKLLWPLHPASRRHAQPWPPPAATAAPAFQSHLVVRRRLAASSFLRCLVLLVLVLVLPACDVPPFHGVAQRCVEEAFAHMLPRP